MKIWKCLLIGSAILGSAAVVGGSGQTWKGMLQAQPAQSSLDDAPRLLCLTGFKTVSVVVEELPDGLKDSLAIDDVSAWATNRLKNMGVVIVSQAEQSRVFLAADESSDEKTLAVGDRHRSHVYVNLNARPLSSGQVYGNISVEVRRGVFVYPGHFANGTLWDKAILFYFGSSYDAKTQVREQLNKLFDDLEADWKKCNP